jgi:hypothetical protein
VCAVRVIDRVRLFVDEGRAAWCVDRVADQLPLYPPRCAGRTKGGDAFVDAETTEFGTQIGGHGNGCFAQRMNGCSWHK